MASSTSSSFIHFTSCGARGLSDLMRMREFEETKSRIESDMSGIIRNGTIEEVKKMMSDNSELGPDTILCGKTILYHACKSRRGAGRIELCEFLLSDKFSPMMKKSALNERCGKDDWRNEGNTILMELIKEKYDDDADKMCELIINAGADLFKKGEFANDINYKNNNSLLFMAAENGKERICKLLLEHGANIIYDGNRCFKWAEERARRSGYIKLADYLKSQTTREQEEALRKSQKYKWDNYDHGPAGN